MKQHTTTNNNNKTKQTSREPDIEIREYGESRKEKRRKEEKKDRAHANRMRDSKHSGMYYLV